MRPKAAVSILTLISFCLTAHLAIADTAPDSPNFTSPNLEPMQGVPPARNSQVTMHNFRDYPMSKWAFQNSGAPLNTVMIPRQGNIVQLPGPSQSQLGEKLFTTAAGDQQRFDQIFESNYADGVAIIKGGELLHESYFHSFNAHAQHIWFSMSKSLASSAFGLLVEQGKVKLDASPADYIPELKGSGFERVTIQQVLDHGTSLDFKETYTDITSDFALYYAPALNMGWLPGARDVQPNNSEIYGVHDFLSRFIKPDPKREPGDNFDYNSSNADVLGWLIARISGQPFQDFIQQNIWAKLGAEHDAMIAVDRAYMPAVTGGMNSTLRDAARFGMMIRDSGKFNGQQIIPANWIAATLDISDQLEANMVANSHYKEETWSAYHNMWWILDASIGEFAAVGIHGQVIYINRKADTVMAWFSSQPVAGAAKNESFRAKLRAAREMAAGL
jgi:CubicO group peptidase (beta-lactamase class C family)